MNDDTDKLEEIDLELMAYADGVFDHDPARKQEIENRIGDRPELAERLRVMQSQNDILRNAYAGLLRAPVPERLARVLDERSVEPGYSRAKAASAAAAIAIVAAVGGWQFGEIYDQDRKHETVSEEFVRQSYQRFVESRTDEHNLAKVQSAGDVPVNWLSDRLSLRLRAPDLRPEGYSMVHRETVKIGETQMVRLEYASSENDTFSLFLRPRWESRHREVRIVTEDDVSLAVWLDGPLAATLAGKVSAKELEKLAGKVRAAMRSENGVKPVIKPATGAEKQADLSSDNPKSDIPPAVRGVPLDSTNVRQPSSVN